MHYGNIVIVDPSNNVLENEVKRMMGPNEEDGGFWDWYQIGGRWTGLFDGYDPEKDPDNQEHCRMCGGTGKRTDMILVDGCNGCQGKGVCTKRPTEWKKYPGDVIPISKLKQEHVEDVDRVVCSFGHFDIESYLPWRTGAPSFECFAKNEMPPASWLRDYYNGHYAVVVDNHQ